MAYNLRWSQEAYENLGDIIDDIETKWEIDKLMTSKRSLTIYYWI